MFSKEFLHMALLTTL